MSEKPYPTNPAAGPYSEPPPPYPASSQPQHFPINQDVPQFGGGYPPMSSVPMPPPGQYYAPPQQGPPTTTYYPPTTTTTTTVIMAGPGFGLGPHPINTQCPNCHAQVLTETRAQAGTLTWLICICCVFFGFIFGCCLIPFCIDDLQDVEHRCPQCKHFLGSYRRM